MGSAEWWPVTVPEQLAADPDLPSELVGGHVYLDTARPPRVVDVIGRVEAARWHGDDELEVQLWLGWGWDEPVPQWLYEGLSRLSLLVAMKRQSGERLLKLLVVPALPATTGEA